MGQSRNPQLYLLPLACFLIARVLPLAMTVQREVAVAMTARKEVPLAMNALEEFPLARTAQLARALHRLPLQADCLS